MPANVRKANVASRPQTGSSAAAQSAGNIKDAEIKVTPVEQQQAPNAIESKPSIEQPTLQGMIQQEPNRPSFLQQQNELQKDIAAMQTNKIPPVSALAPKSTLTQKQPISSQEQKSPDLIPSSGPRVSRTEMNAQQVEQSAEEVPNYLDTYSEFTAGPTQEENIPDELGQFMAEYMIGEETEDYFQELPASYATGIKQDLSGAETHRLLSNIKTIPGAKIVRSENKPDPAIAEQLTRQRPPKMKGEYKDVEKQKHKVKGWYGQSVYDKMIGDNMVLSDEVSVGSDLIAAVLRQPSQDLLQTLAEKTGVELDINSPTILSDTIDLINSNRIPVVISKAPVSAGQSAHIRYLRVHSGRGIHLTPPYAAMMKADFDGDDATVTWNGERVSLVHRDAMDYLLGPDGSLGLDPKFFILPNFIDQNFEEIRKTIDTIFLVGDKALSYADTAKRNRIIDAIARLCVNRSDEYWKELLATIADVSRKSLPRVLDDMYENFRILRILEAEEISFNDVHSSFELAKNSDGSALGYPIPEDCIADKVLERIVTETVAGRTPPSFQEVMDMFAYFSGEVPDNNSHFRCTTNLLKLIHMNRDVLYGKDDLREFYYASTMYAASCAASNLTNAADRAVYARSTVRQLVVAEVGYPSQYPTFEQFAENFSVSYNKYAGLFHLASYTFAYNMKLNDKARPIELIEDQTIKSFATPFLNVYGDMTIQAIFGDRIQFDSHFKNKGIWKTNQGRIAILQKYKSMTLKRFSLNNRIITTSALDNEERKTKYGKYYKRKIKDYIPKKNYNAGVDLTDIDLVYDVLIAVADKRTSSATKYGKTINKSFTSLFRILQKLKGELAKDNERRDWVAFANYHFNVISEFAPKIFMHYGMDDLRNFYLSEWGQKLINAKNSEEVGSIYEAMLINFRLDRIRAKEEVLEDTIEDIVSSNQEENENIEKRFYTVKAAHDSEVRSLQRSSMAWDTIVRELYRTDEESIWKRIVNAKQLYGNEEGWFQKFLDKELGTGIDGEKFEIQRYLKDGAKHNSLIDFLLDTTVPYNFKNSILTDVVKIDQKFLYYLEDEAAYQLELDGGNTHADMEPKQYDRASVFDVLTKFDNAVIGMTKKDHDEIIKKARKNLETFSEDDVQYLLTNLTDDAFFVDIDDNLYCECLNYVFDKTFKQGEKGTTSPGMKVLVQMLITQQTGAILDDFQNTDNKLLGQIRPNKISMRDLIRVLADETSNEAIATYSSETSRPMYITRNDIFEAAGVDNLHDFFYEFPYFWDMCCQHTFTVFGDGNDSRAVLVAKERPGSTMYNLLYNRDETESVRNRIRMQMMNHYRFGGLVAASVAQRGMRRRKTQKQLMQNLDALIDYIYYYAYEAVIENSDAPLSMIKIMQDFGIPIENTRLNDGSMKTRYPRRTSEEVYKDFADEVHYVVNQYIDEAKKIISKSNVASMTKPKLNTQFSLGRIDGTTINTYYDTKQELSGARVSMSVGIEGSNTFDIALWEAILGPEDMYINANQFDDDFIEVNFRGQETSVGVKIGEMSMSDIRKAAGKEPIMIVAPTGWKFQDRTLDNRGRQIPTMGAITTYKREKSAEDNNLKVRKAGEDKRFTDSISKIVDFNFPDPINIMDSVEQAYAETGIHGARLALAKELENANRLLQYGDFGITDYMQIAKYMVVERVAPENEGSYVDIRTLDQIFNAIKHNTDPELWHNGKLKELRAQANEIANAVEGINGVYEENNYMIMQLLLENIHVPGKQEINSLYKMNSSSVPRNFNLLRKILERTGISRINDRKYDKLIEDYRKKGGKTYNDIFDGTGYKFAGEIGKYTIEGLGQSMTWVIPYNPDLKEETLSKALGRARELGITVIIESTNPILASEAMQPYIDFISQFPLKKDENKKNRAPWLMIPFFEVELNESFDSRPPAPGSYHIKDDAVSYLVETSFDPFNQGDAQGIATENWKSKLDFNFHGNKDVGFDTMFASVYEVLDRSQNDSAEFMLMSDEEVQKYIINDYRSENDYCHIDLGISDLNRSAEDEMARMNNRIEEYARNFTGQNLLEYANPDQIIGWTMCILNRGTEREEKIAAPIILFRDNVDSLTAPEEFECQININQNRSCIEVEWKYAGDPTNGGYVKAHDGTGPANKMMIDLGKKIGDFLMRHGRPVDLFVNANTTKNRRIASDKRLSTFDTLWYTARMAPFGYNFAIDVADSFPNNPELKERVSNEFIPVDEWREIMRSNPDLRFCKDDDVNEWIRNQIRLCLSYGTVSPSHLLSTYDTRGRYEVQFEFRAFYDDSFKYQSDMMKFFNLVTSNDRFNVPICPAGLEAGYNGELFKPIGKDDRVIQDDPYNYGVLQMEIPYPSETGGTFWKWETVYAGLSFVGQDFSGMKKPSPAGSSHAMDETMTMMLLGKMPSNSILGNVYEWATADLGKIIPEAATSIVSDEPDFIKRLR